MSRPANIVNTEDVAVTELAHARFKYRRRMLSAAAGGARLGCSLYEITPGESAFPFHYHWANEEAIYVLDGTGTLRLGEHEVGIRAGDYVAIPPGPEHPHRLINSSDRTLKYLCFSTQIDPEVVVYPDSNKVAIAVGPPRKRIFAGVYRMESGVDYYDREPDG